MKKHKIDTRSSQTSLRSALCPLEEHLSFFFVSSQFVKKYFHKQKLCTMKNYSGHAMDPKHARVKAIQLACISLKATDYILLHPRKHIE